MISSKHQRPVRADNANVHVARTLVVLRAEIDHIATEIHFPNGLQGGDKSLSRGIPACPAQAFDQDAGRDVTFQGRVVALDPYIELAQVALKFTYQPQLRLSRRRQYLNELDADGVLAELVDEVDPGERARNEVSGI